MILLRCKICNGEVDIVNNEKIDKKIKCRKCGFSNINDIESKNPEIIVIKRKRYNA